MRRLSRRLLCSLLALLLLAGGLPAGCAEGAAPESVRV